MAKQQRTIWRCQQCGSVAPRWLGRCNDCGEYGSFVEEAERSSSSRRGQERRGSGAAGPVALADLSATVEGTRLATGIEEFDRVLGGGLVSGGLTLLGGEPGIGKSTLVLQAADGLARSGFDVLYVCGEESPHQVAMRARRIGADATGLLLLPEVDVAAVEQAVLESRPAVLVVDSIQTACDPDLTGTPGSVGQVRASTARLVGIAKDLNVTTIVVGHVTKDGAIAGPRVLEHMVDTVLYFEGDRDHAFRIVRAVKNRFGSTNDVGIFEMGERGLAGVEAASAALLSGRALVPGSVVMAAMEGSRPLLVEIQALATPSFLPAPRRLATGIEGGRLLQVLAVLERRAELSFAGQDVYVTVAGGLRVAEPAVDLPLALALASALADEPAPPDFAIFGEIGLTGQVRPVAHTEARVAEAARMGIARTLGQAPASVPMDRTRGLERVATVSEALGILA